MHVNPDGMNAATFELPVEGADEPILAACHALELPGNRKLEICVQSDETDDISRGIALGRYAIPAHYRLLDALVPPGSRVIDLGSHIGTFALYAAELGHEVIAVDASRRNIALLRESIRRNRFDRLHAIHAAVSDRPGHVEFTELGAYGIVASKLLQWQTTRVPSVAIDTLLPEFGWDRCDFVKMDIEGSEPIALAGMARLLAGDRAPHVMLESNGHTLHLLEQTPNALLEILERAGFRSWLVRDRVLRPVNAADLQYECVVDYLALKGEVPAIPGWRFGPPISPEEQVASVVAGSCDANAHVRAHVARTLRRAPLEVHNDVRVRSALVALTRDPDPEVREAVAWYDGAGDSSR